MSARAAQPAMMEEETQSLLIDPVAVQPGNGRKVLKIAGVVGLVLGAAAVAPRGWIMQEQVSKGKDALMQAQGAYGALPGPYGAQQGYGAGVAHGPWGAPIAAHPEDFIAHADAPGQQNFVPFADAQAMAAAAAPNPGFPGPYGAEQGYGAGVGHGPQGAPIAVHPEGFIAHADAPGQQPVPQPYVPQQVQPSGNFVGEACNAGNQVGTVSLGNEWWYICDAAPVNTAENPSAEFCTLTKYTDGQAQVKNTMCDRAVCSSCGAACPNANVKLPMRRMANGDHDADCACGAGSDAGIGAGASFFVERPNEQRRPGCGMPQQVWPGQQPVQPSGNFVGEACNAGNQAGTVSLGNEWWYICDAAPANTAENPSAEFCTLTKYTDGQAQVKNTMCDRAVCSSCGPACPNANVKLPMRRMANGDHAADCACGAGSNAGIGAGASFFVERPNEQKRPGCGMPWV